MPTVKLGSPLKHALSVGDSVSVNGASTVEVISGGPYSITTVSSSQTFGPYGAPVTLRITSTSGDVAVTETNAPVLSTSDVVVDGAGSLRRKDDGSPISPGTGSGSVAVQALSADRALAAGDLAANLVLTANRAVTLASGLGAGFNTQFSNGGTSSVTITVTPGAGVTLNGASSAVTRTLAAGQTTALLPVGTNAYILPGA